MVNEEDEEFEEFDETNEVEPEERTAPEPKLPEPIEFEEEMPRKKGRPAKIKEVKEEKAVPVQQAQPQPQYVGVPRAVPIETMINELYDGQQEIKQVLMVIMEKLNIK